MADGEDEKREDARDGDEAPATKDEQPAPKKAAPRPRRRRPASDATAVAKPAPPDTAGAQEASALVPVTISEERAARRALGMGGGLAALGLALVGTGPSEAGTIICVGGLLVLIYGIHTFGRLGPEPAS